GLKTLSFGKKALMKQRYSSVRPVRGDCCRYAGTVAGAVGRCRGSMAGHMEEGARAIFPTIIRRLPWRMRCSACIALGYATQSVVTGVEVRNCSEEIGRSGLPGQPADLDQVFYRLEFGVVG